MKGLPVLIILFNEVKGISAIIIGVVFGVAARIVYRWRYRIVVGVAARTVYHWTKPKRDLHRTS